MAASGIPVIFALHGAQRLFGSRPTHFGAGLHFSGHEARPFDFRSLTIRVGNDRRAHCGQGKAEIAGADARDGSD